MEKEDSSIVHWYNQRAEDSENRIKELKLDFGGDTLPCSDFKANALYFLISALSYSIFTLMRALLPEELSHHRAHNPALGLVCDCSQSRYDGTAVACTTKGKTSPVIVQ